MCKRLLYCKRHIKRYFNEIGWETILFFMRKNLIKIAVIKNIKFKSVLKVKETPS